MANGENNKFRTDPWAYANNSNNLVMLHNMASLIWSDYLLVNQARKQITGSSLLQILDQDKTVGVDLIKKKIGLQFKADNVIFRPCFKMEWMSRTNRSGYPHALFNYRIEISQLPQDPPNDPPIQGYWVPYLTNPVQGTGDLGYVDVPKTNAAYSYIFTGAMNGCHLVVARCPELGKRTTHFRVYHYQSPNAAHVILPPENRRRLRNFDDPNFGEVFYWLDASQYCGPMPNENTAFNFMYKSGPGQPWHLVCQPKKVSTNISNLRHTCSSVDCFQVPIHIPGVN